MELRDQVSRLWLHGAASRVPVYWHRRKVAWWSDPLQVRLQLWRRMRVPLCLNDMLHLVLQLLDDVVPNWEVLSPVVYSRTQSLAGGGCGIGDWDIDRF